jgi:hypothetical protein
MFGIMVVYQNHGDPRCFCKIVVGHPVSDIHMIPNIGCIFGYAVEKFDFD